MALPIADCLGIPKDRVFANRMLWQWDDETMEPSRLVGFDMSEPTARNQGKPQAIALIRQQNPYNSVSTRVCALQFAVAHGYKCVCQHMPAPGLLPAFTTLSMLC